MYNFQFFINFFDFQQIFVQAPAPCLDLTDFPVKADFFEGQYFK